MAYDTQERIAVVAGAVSVGVTLTIGEVVVSIRAPSPAGAAQMEPEQVRAAALRATRRALEVALEEVRLAGG